MAALIFRDGDSTCTQMNQVFNWLNSDESKQKMLKFREERFEFQIDAEVAVNDLFEQLLKQAVEYFGPLTLQNPERLYFVIGCDHCKVEENIALKAIMFQ